MFKGAQSVPQKPRSFRRWIWRLLFLLVLAALGYHAWLFWQVWQLRDHNPDTTAFMEQGLERMRKTNPKARLQYRWVPYEKISADLKRCVIAAEDQKFLDHEGFDFEEMEKAYETNQRRGKIKRGASTLSQQLAKNLFLTAQRTYLRKAEEAILTLIIEHTLSKRRILEIYLNVIEWGNGVYGADAAARHYYGLSAAELDAEQSARLAAMIPNPRFYDRNRDTPYLNERINILLNQMNYMAVP